jgi:hypothetical protein
MRSSLVALSSKESMFMSAGKWDDAYWEVKELNDVWREKSNGDYKLYKTLQGVLKNFSII